MPDVPSDRYADFDAFFAERDTPPLVVKLFGQEWNLPAVMPAGAPLKVARYQVEGREEDDLTGAEVLDLAAEIVPPSVLQEWLNRGLDVEQLGEVLMWVLGQYMSQETDEAGEAGAPTTVGASTSSSADGP